MAATDWWKGCVMSFCFVFHFWLFLGFEQLAFEVRSASTSIISIAILWTPGKFPSSKWFILFSKLQVLLFLQRRIYVCFLLWKAMQAMIAHISLQLIVDGSLCMSISFIFYLFFFECSLATLDMESFNAMLHLQYVHWYKALKIGSLTVRGF